MATVFRRDGSPYWQTAFFDADGQRRYRSTKKRKRSEAVAAAAEMERAARVLLEPGGHAPRRLQAVVEEAAEKAARGTLSEATARTLLDRIAEVSFGERLHNPTIDEWLNEWLDQIRRSREESTAKRYEVVVKPFLDSLPKSKRFAPLASLSSAEIRKFRDSLYDGGRSETTANMAVKILRTPLNAARRQGLIQYNPAEAVETLRSVPVEKAVFSPKQVSALIGASDKEWQGMILTGYYTGARLGDIANLKWKAVDMGRRLIIFTQIKTHRIVGTPIHPELQKWLSKAKRQASPKSIFVFPSMAGRTSGGKSGLSSQFSNLMKTLGIEGTITKKRGKKGRNRSSLSFHSLRHTFNSQLANSGVSQELRQLLTGHASKSANDIYTHAELKTLRRAVKTVPSISAS